MRKGGDIVPSFGQLGGLAGAVSPVRLTKEPWQLLVGSCAPNRILDLPSTCFSGTGMASSANRSPAELNQLSIPLITER
jgi:hypothetical protein